MSVPSEVYLGRQAVYDVDRQVFGYELLYRDGPHGFDPGRDPDSDPDRATRAVMERSLLHWGLERVVGYGFGLINASVSLVEFGLHEAMPAEGIIFEICEPEPFADDTVEVLRRARADGYHFALDNVTRLSDVRRSRLLPSASIVKIELNNADEVELPALIELARERSPGVLVVAEKVETIDDFKRCVALGFDLFQGWCFGRPEILHRPARPVDAAAARALHVALTCDQVVDIDRAEAIIVGSTSLAFRLLAAVNASSFGLDRRVSSIREALDAITPAELRCLADLLGRHDQDHDQDVDVDADVTTRGAVRAQMIGELLADSDLAHAAATVGVLSVADELHHTPLRELLDELPLDDAVADALTDGRGTLGITLDLVRACERNDDRLLDSLAPGRVEELRDEFERARRSIDSRRAEAATSCATADGTPPAEVVLHDEADPVGSC